MNTRTAIARPYGTTVDQKADLRSSVDADIERAKFGMEGVRDCMLKEENAVEYPLRQKIAGAACVSHNLNDHRISNCPATA
ncbi:MAG: hypothetical protein IPO87_03515 [Flavobacteriales bacterium]|nr:hypothetical protein [Flavobacteriales bacterium]